MGFEKPGESHELPDINEQRRLELQKIQEEIDDLKRRFGKKDLEAVYKDNIEPLFERFDRVRLNLPFDAKSEKVLALGREEKEFLQAEENDEDRREREHWMARDKLTIEKEVLNLINRADEFARNRRIR